jgi:FixJ family two-component response regulator
VQDALRRATSSHQQEYRQSEVQQRLETLSSRENDVLKLITDGYPNKVIAEKLSLSIKTVEAHRAKLMQKMQAGSLAELLRMIYQGKP